LPTIAFDFDFDMVDQGARERKKKEFIFNRTNASSEAGVAKMLDFSHQLQPRSENSLAHPAVNWKAPN
jgi:hypothetical protein